MGRSRMLTKSLVFSPLVGVVLGVVLDALYSNHTVQTSSAYLTVLLLLLFLPSFFELQFEFFTTKPRPLRHDCSMYQTTP